MKNIFHSCSIFTLFLSQIVWISPVAAEFSKGPFTLSGFGTLSGSWLSNEHIDYVTASQAIGPGKSHDFDLGLDSRLGGQLNIALTSSTLITAQAVVERLPDTQFMPRLTQANIRQELGENWVVRIGRIQSPAFLASDYRLANFSNPWVRTPNVLYDLYPLTHIDSAEFTYHRSTNLGILSLNAGYGWVKYPFATLSTDGMRGTADVQMDNMFYANMKLDNGPWRFKVSWLHTETTVNVPELDQFVNFVREYDPRAAQQLAADHKGGSLYAIGFNYDANDWLVMGEWAIGDPDQPFLFNFSHAGYLTVGYHFGRWLPQLTLGYRATLNDRVHSDIAEIDATIDAIKNSQRTDYQTIAFGLNYSINNNFIVRGQVDVVDPKKNSIGPYLEYNERYNRDQPRIDALFSIGLDFVF